MVYVIATISLTAASQLVQKVVALRRHDDSSLSAYLHDPYCWLALILLACGMLTWLCALESIEISKAYALLSINYLLVPLAAVLIFDEHFSPRRWFGAIILCAGVLLIGHS